MYFVIFYSLRFDLRLTVPFFFWRNTWISGFGFRFNFKHDWEEGTPTSTVTTGPAADNDSPSFSLP